MWPILFKWGPVTLHTYGALVALGFFLGYYRALFLARRRGISDDVMADFAWIALVAGLAGARVLYVLFNLGYYRGAPLDVLKVWQGGLVWYGGLIAGAAASAAWFRHKKISVALAADVCAPGLALGHALGRLGCFFAGCCYGRACALPWAVTFRNPDSLAPQNAPLHPSQLYESGLNLLLFLLLDKLARSEGRLRPGRGLLAMLYAGSYSVIRFLVEFTRGDDRGPVFASLTSTQWISVAGLSAALAGWALLARRKDA
jgi:phosphatidylglycerol:prolipoprotein diacylglycerol transferase